MRSQAETTSTENAHRERATPSSSARASQPAPRASSALADATPTDVTSPERAALVSTSPFIELEVEGFRDAVVSLPLGAREPRPVIVAMHGNYDRPEWQCEVWRDWVSSGCFVLCPRGIPRADAPKSEDRWTYGAQDATERELVAALAALEKRYPEHVDSKHTMFAGFSLGAILGRRIVQSQRGRFSRAILTEGAYSGWSIASAKALREAGIERVLFACGQSACTHAARASAAALTRGGVEASVADGGNAGHTYDGPVARAISQKWPWLVQGSAVWSSVVE